MNTRASDGLLLWCSACEAMHPRGRFRVVSGRRRGSCRESEKPSRAAVAARRRGRMIGTYSPADVRSKLDAQGWQCRGCRRDVRVCGFHVDHRIPIAKGGSNEAWNIQILCPACNRRKGAKLP